MKYSDSTKNKMIFEINFAQKEIKTIFEFRIKKESDVIQRTYIYLEFEKDGN